MARTAQRGFTLVELMIVVAIIAILGAFMIGVNSATVGGASAQTEAEKISATLNFARTRALSTRKIHKVEIHPEMSPQQIYVYAAATTGMSTTNLNTLNSVYAIQIPKTVNLWSVVSGAQPSGASPAQSTAISYIYFRPDGSADAGATIYVTEKIRQKYYRVLTYQATGSSYARSSW